MDQTGAVDKFTVIESKVGTSSLAFHVSTKVVRNSGSQFRSNQALAIKELQNTPSRMQNVTCFYMSIRCFANRVIKSVDSTHVKVTWNNMAHTKAVWSCVFPPGAHRSWQSSKVDKGRPRLTHVKTIGLLPCLPGTARSVLPWQQQAGDIFCKEQRNTKPLPPLFSIQTLGLKQDGSPTLKETLWKR